MPNFSQIGPDGIERTIVAESLDLCLDLLGIAGGIWQEQQEQGVMAEPTKVIQLPAPTLINQKPSTSNLVIDDISVRPRKRFLAISYVSVDESGAQIPDGERIQETAEGDLYDAVTATSRDQTVELGRALLIAKGRIDPASEVVDVKR